MTDDGAERRLRRKLEKNDGKRENEIKKNNVKEIVLRTFLSQLPRLQLVSRLLEDAPSWPHDCCTRLFPRPSCKFGRFGEEAVARMDGINVVLLDEGDQVRNIHVRGGAGQFNCSRGVTHVRSVIAGIDGEGGNGELSGGGDDAGCDLAAVGEWMLEIRQGTSSWDSAHRLQTRRRLIGRGVGLAILGNSWKLRCSNNLSQNYTELYFSR